MRYSSKHLDRSRRLSSSLEPTNCYRYRPSPNRSYTMGHSSPTPGTQMMYPYGNVPLQGQQQQQNVQQMSRPSPPQPTWAVPQSHNPYYSVPRGPIMGSREESGHLLARSGIATSQSPALSNATYSNSMAGAPTLPTTDYFPGVIDTSKLHLNLCEHRILTIRKVHGVKKYVKSWSPSRL